MGRYCRTSVMCIRGRRRGGCGARLAPGACIQGLRARGLRTFGARHPGLNGSRPFGAFSAKARKVRDGRFY